ncbi:hypothetical protein PV325_004768 [Microctonus aethiopoides]|nr:hypothetical protein PV325_004768 [Microctonus aethiopoides]
MFPTSKQNGNYGGKDFTAHLGLNSWGNRSRKGSVSWICDCKGNYGELSSAISLLSKSQCSPVCEFNF